MELFHQTVSMKSVGNLTEFVREHMLASFDIESRIRALVAHFDDLNRAHEAVLIAKDQIARLTPLVADCDALATVTDEIERLRACREALRPWFASLKAELLRRRIATLDAEVERHERHITDLGGRKRDAEHKRDELRRAIAANGGDRIAGIIREIERLSEERAARERRCTRYDELAGMLGLLAASDGERFAANRPALARERETLDELHESTQGELTDAAIAQRELRGRSAELEAELDSLRRRRSSIPKTVLDLRERLCAESRCDEHELPFVGELVAVREEAADWEGAAERVLHTFALSLLVPSSRYAQVAEWVDRTHLNGRIVYYRVHVDGERGTYDRRKPDAESLVHKLTVRLDSPFSAWLEVELARRFDYVCCDTLERFRREPRALTRSGQIKTHGERHEKDDRRSIADRSAYVLGWSNERKIAALEHQLADLAARMGELQRRVDRVETRRKEARARLGLVEQLSAFESFRDLDWRPIAVAIEQLAVERRELEEGSDVLRALEQQSHGCEASLRELEAELIRRQREQSVAEEKRAQANATLVECEAVLEATPLDAQERWFPQLASIRDEALGEHQLSIESCDNRERDMRDWLQARIDAADKRSDRLRETIVRAMQEYRGRFPAEARELDAAVEAADAYRQTLERLRADDLPRFEARFKKLLNENAIREIANFQSQLNRELQTTAERIESINRSLHGIDYNPGRYIALEELNAALTRRSATSSATCASCTEGTLTGSDDGGDGYAEAKFLAVKRIIERFRGREGTAEIDRRWTRKVTDVRTWQAFSASERWREDDREHEHYTDSGGKSGGQKEKLAYTVLAASLAYQFGLERGASRSFRFVAIDEAFGRGSDESAHYGLELFKRLGLQLLIVTPLQKIHVIEPYVSAVAFAHNDGRSSQLHTLTIEEFHAQRAARTS